jgi:hypothetical protein
VAAVGAAMVIGVGAAVGGLIPWKAVGTTVAVVLVVAASVLTLSTRLVGITDLIVRSISRMTLRIRSKE